MIKRQLTLDEIEMNQELEMKYFHLVYCFSERGRGRESQVMNAPFYAQFVLRTFTIFVKVFPY